MNGRPRGMDALLRDVSRTFYLSLRFLPAAVRDPLSLAYLLARLSDTIADSGELDTTERMRLLEVYPEWLRDERELDVRMLRGGSEGEQRLCQRADVLREWLGEIGRADRREIEWVLGHIVAGQREDVERFGEGGEVTALESAGDLNRYTWHVAGCVGAFWTRLCLRKIPRYAIGGDEGLAGLGEWFGCGLQLVNVLRDFPRDIRSGRCYLPVDELATAGLTPQKCASDPSLAAPIASPWIEGARRAVTAGVEYAARIRPVRLRFAVLLPAELGLRTLDLVAARFGEEGVKLSRSEVRAICWRSLWKALRR